VHVSRLISHREFLQLAAAWPIQSQRLQVIPPEGLTKAPDNSVENILGLHLMKCLAKTQGEKVRINAVLPGYMVTEWVRILMGNMLIVRVFEHFYLKMWTDSFISPGDGPGLFKCFYTQTSSKGPNPPKQWHAAQWALIIASERSIWRTALPYIQLLPRTPP
jgi:hypothetical protein